MAKMGRPKSLNAKDKSILIRLTESEYKRLKEYAIQNNTQISQLFRQRFSDILSDKWQINKISFCKSTQKGF